MTGWNPIATVPPYPAESYARLADRIGGILRTRSDVVFVQGEAIVALEAVAASVGRPGRSVLVLVTGPYGAVFGRWLEASGSEVRYLSAESLTAIEPSALDAELTERPADVVYVTHGEAATGVVNPLRELAAVARTHGALIAVDAVASVGGHTLLVDEWGVDIAVIGAQKCLGGPSSLSVVSVSDRGWEALSDSETHAHDDAHVNGEAGALATKAASTLSLLDLKRDWLDAGRGALPGMPDPLSFWALHHAVDAVLAAGVDAVIERHREASALARAAVRALGGEPGSGQALEPAPATDAAASHLVTLAPVPDGVSVDALLDAAHGIDVTLSPALGAASGRFVRINHTGARATRAAVATSVLAYAAALRRLGVPVDVNAAADVLGC